ncbi:uncharacterized protein MONBRDRAFT_13075 [Monosiga brevicollis MX1]|uniref:Uncharacterized protein n=1 Tax=Monosiga brevicollis TaxID=81824 RepID=A9VE75_MONBE|nr:uncharacterized protein MONBRDRAFT_13075 [Monosiga brevicollis MX1]EDQ84170.1 predicted protein [Monosiga brevicollis MX1]|eukprot:XP_001751024.1 hypothetical protein [Monosiga brevicollis MX1]
MGQHGEKQGEEALAPGNQADDQQHSHPFQDQDEAVETTCFGCCQVNQFRPVLGTVLSQVDPTNDDCIYVTKEFRWAVQPKTAASHQLVAQQPTATQSQSALQLPRHRRSQRLHVGPPCFTASATSACCAYCRTRRTLGFPTSGAKCFPVHACVAVAGGLVGLVADMVCCPMVCATACIQQHRPTLLHQDVAVTIDTRRGWAGGLALR